MSVNVLDILYSLLGEPVEGTEQLYLIFGFVLVIVFYYWIFNFLKKLFNL